MQIHTHTKQRHVVPSYLEICGTEVEAQVVRSWFLLIFLVSKKANNFLNYLMLNSD